MAINERTKFIVNDIGLPVTPAPSSGTLLAPQGLALIGLTSSHNRSFAPQTKVAGILDFCADTFWSVFILAFIVSPSQYAHVVDLFGINAELEQPPSLTVYKFPTRTCSSTNIYCLCFSMTTASDDILSWTNQDPRESLLFNSWGSLYRFQVRCHIQSSTQYKDLLSRRPLHQMVRALQHCGEPSARTRKTVSHRWNGRKTVVLVVSLLERLVGFGSQWPFNYSRLSVPEYTSYVRSCSTRPSSQRKRFWIQ